MPTRNPLRLEEIEQEMLSSEVGLTYVHELQYSNGAIYRGQIKAVDEKERKEIMSPSTSRNSVLEQSINAEQRGRMSLDDRN
jgi:hypothetical protein